MTEKQKNEILTALEQIRNSYRNECEKEIADMNGRIAGAFYMTERISDIIRIEYEVQESENEK